MRLLLLGCTGFVGKELVPTLLNENHEIYIVSRKPDYPNLEECIAWVEEKLKRDGSDYKLTKQDLDDIETAYEFQTSDLN